MSASATAVTVRGSQPFSSERKASRPDPSMAPRSGSSPDGAGSSEYTACWNSISAGPGHSWAAAVPMEMSAIAAAASTQQRSRARVTGIDDSRATEPSAPLRRLSSAVLVSGVMSESSNDSWGGPRAAQLSVALTSSAVKPPRG